MYSQPRQPTHVDLNTAKHMMNDQQYRALFTCANRLLLASCLLTILSIIVAYVIPEIFPLNIQLAAHLLMLIAVTGIKLAYLARCIARHGLGAKQL